MATDIGADGGKNLVDRIMRDTESQWRLATWLWDCPSCGAKAGDPCVKGKSKGYKDGPHKRRLNRGAA